MNIDDRKERHARAMNVFEAEAREQQLSSIALRQATTGTEGVARVIGPDNSDADNPVTTLHVIDRASEANILSAHLQIRSARMQAARMAATDPVLVRLYTMIDGEAPDSPESQPITVEGEATEISVEPVALPPPIEPT